MDIQAKQDEVKNDLNKKGLLQSEVSTPITLIFINIGLSILFLLMIRIGFFPEIAVYGFIVNTWLALFNMIPFYVFDGAKIWRWNKQIYFGIVAIGILFMYLRKFIWLIADKF